MATLAAIEATVTAATTYEAGLTLLIDGVATQVATSLTSTLTAASVSEGNQTTIQAATLVFFTAALADVHKIADALKANVPLAAPGPGGVWHATFGENAPGMSIEQITPIPE